MLESIPDLSRLKRLQKLHLSDLSNLVEIPCLGELESLKFVDIMRCYAIEHLLNLLKLENLRYLKLDGCRRMRAVKV